MTPFLISCSFGTPPSGFSKFSVRGICFSSMSTFFFVFVPCLRGLYSQFRFMFYSKGLCCGPLQRSKAEPGSTGPGQTLAGAGPARRASRVGTGSACRVRHRLPRAVRTRWAHTLRSLTAAGTADPACARERLGGCRPYNSASTSICATSWASERARAPSSSTMARSSGSKCSPLCPSPCESETACPHPERRRLLRVVPGGSRLTPGVLQVSGGSHGHLLSTNGGKS